MGYSCTDKAYKTLSRTLNNANGQLVNDPNYSNTWETKAGRFFFEQGRENTDGAITGTVFKFTGPNQAIKVGGLKIAPNGKPIRWPGMPKDKIVYQEAMFQII